MYKKIKDSPYKTIFSCIFLLFFVFSVLFSFSFNTAYALPSKEEIEEIYKKSGESGIVDAYAAAFDGAGDFKSTTWSVSSRLVGTSFGQSAKEFLRLNATNDAKGNSSSAIQDIWDTIKKIAEPLKIIGFSFVALFFVLELIDVSTRGALNVEAVLKSLIKLFVAIICIENCTIIFQTVLDFGAALYDFVEKGSADASVVDNYVALATKIDNNGFLANLEIWAADIFPWLLLYIADIFITVIAAGRVLELAIRVSFAPIGMADMFEGGTRSSGFRYLKKILALSVQGAMILACLTIYSSLMTKRDPDVIQIISLSLATVTIATKTQSFANDLFGV